MSSSIRYRSKPDLPLANVTRRLFAFCNPIFESMNDEELVHHIAKWRDEAYQITYCPCFGMFRFLDLRNRLVKVYPEVIASLRDDPSKSILDLGCATGHDTRGLLLDGVRPNQIVASDLFPELFDIGFKMFGDGPDDAHLDGLSWQQADIFEPSDIEKLKSLSPKGQGFDYIYIGSFLHLFPFDLQRSAAFATVSLLRRHSGSLILGRQTGTAVGEARTESRILATDTTKGQDLPVSIYKDPYRHDSVSFTKMFDDVGKEMIPPCSFKISVRESQRDSTYEAEGDGKVIMSFPSGATPVRKVVLDFSIRLE